MLTDQQVLAEAVRVVNHAFLGMLTTVDEHGVPHARWMGTASAQDGLRLVYTLSARKSRKIDHIARNANVCWVFSTEGYSDVATLFGQAAVAASPLVTQRVWDCLLEYARTWCMAALGNRDDLEMVAIETRVTAVEYVSPRLGMYSPRRVELAKSRE